MQRSAVGLIAVALLAGAAACYFIDVEPEREAGRLALLGALWRVGIVMALLWLALPELLRVRGKFVWMLLAVAVGLLLLRPKMAPLVLLFCLIYAVVRPRMR
jgi:hypothetical protein